MKQQSLTIITAQQKFKDWRDNKLPGEKIPKELWDIVRQILFNPQYKITIVTRGLGISTEQLRQKFPEYFTKLKKPIKSLSDTTTKFVQASLAPLTTVIPSTSGLITIEHKNGTKFILREPTTEQFSIIVKLFMEEI